MKKIMIIAIAIIMVILAGILIWYNTSISPVNTKSEKEVKIEIPIGTSRQAIAKVLKEENLIKNEFAFRIFIKLNKITDFQAGNYSLKESMNLKEITRNIAEQAW